MLTLGQALFGLDELVDVKEPLLEGELVGEPGLVGAAVSKGDAGLYVPVLDCGRYQASRPARGLPDLSGGIISRWPRARQ
jgi:hypothetical protein